MLKQINCLFVFCFFNVFTHFKFDACNKLQKSCDKFTTVLNHLSISQRTISFWELWKLIVKLCWWNSFLFLSVGQLQLLKSRGSPLGYVALPKMLGHRSGLLAGQSSMHPQTRGLMISKNNLECDSSDDGSLFHFASIDIQMNSS